VKDKGEEEDYLLPCSHRVSFGERTTKRKLPGASWSLLMAPAGVPYRGTDALLRENFFHKESPHKLKEGEKLSGKRRKKKGKS